MLTCGPFTLLLVLVVASNVGHVKSLQSSGSQRKPKSQAMCGPLSLPEGITATCPTSVSYKSVPCGEKSAVGTEATLTCKSSYIPADVNAYSSLQMCDTDLKWKQSRSFSCVIDCGRLQGSRSEASLMVIAKTSKISRFPWHVAIFRNVSTAVTYICGGTLIRPNFVVTALRCLGNEKVEEILVVAAPTSRNFSKNEQSGNQIMRVKNVLSNPNHDPFTKLQPDIALVHLEESFELNEHVGVACLDKNVYKNFTHRSGLVPGFGIDASNNPTDTPRIARMSLMDLNICSEVLSVLLSLDQICASYINGTSECIENFGGGMVFLRDDRYYLEAITNVEPVQDDGTKICNNQTYGIYTTVPKNLDWLTETMNRIEDNEFTNRIKMKISGSRKFRTTERAAVVITTSAPMIYYYAEASAPTPPLSSSRSVHPASENYEGL